MNLSDGEYTVRINGINQWIKIDGSKNETRPLILLHGGPGGNHYTFERTVGPLLSKKRTIVYYEQRGCGRSEKPPSSNDYTIDYLIDDFREIKQWLGTDQVDLLGYSFGGELALEFAYALNEEINRIVLSSPSLMDSVVQKTVQISGILSVTDNHQIINHIKGLTLEESYDQLWNLVDTKAIDQLLFEDQNIAQKNRRLWEESQLSNTGDMMDSLHSTPKNPPLVDRLDNIYHQTLILTGVFDRNTGINVSKIIHRNLNNSHWVLFNESAHFPDLEEPNKFVGSILNFLK